MKYFGSEVGSKNEEMSKESKKVNWNDFNYPCCLRIFHYDSEETPEVLQMKVTLIRVNHILIITACLLNFFTNIVGTAQGVPLGGIRIGISIFLILIWLPISFYIFHVPYRVYMRDEEARPCVFYILSILTICWFFIWSIADFADANGFIMVYWNSNSGRAAASLFGAITAIMMLLIAVLGVVNLGYFCKRNSVSADD